MDGYRKKWPEHLYSDNSERTHNERQQEKYRREEEKKSKDEIPPDGKVQEQMVLVYAGVEYGKKYYRTRAHGNKTSFVLKENVTQLPNICNLFEDTLSFINDSIKKHKKHIGSCRSRYETKEFYFKTIEDAQKAKLKIDKFLNENVSL